MTRRAVPVLLAAALLSWPVAGVHAATPPATEASQAWSPSPEMLAQAAGAVAGFGIYSLYFAPQLTAAEGAVAFLGGRMVALTLAGVGAVAGTFAYDYWSGQPYDYSYFWHRGGFVAGVAAGIVAFGVLGYPVDGGSTWLGWVANRATLLGAGALGAYGADRWYNRAP